MDGGACTESAAARSSDRGGKGGVAGSTGALRGRATARFSFTTAAPRGRRGVALTGRSVGEAALTGNAGFGRTRGCSSSRTGQSEGRLNRSCERARGGGAARSTLWAEAASRGFGSGAGVARIAGAVMPAPDTGRCGGAGGGATGATVLVGDGRWGARLGSNGGRGLPRVSRSSMSPRVGEDGSGSMAKPAALTIQGATAARQVARASALNRFWVTPRIHKTNADEAETRPQRHNRLTLNREWLVNR